MFGWRIAKIIKWFLSIESLVKVMGSWLHLFLAWNHMQSSGLRNQGLDRPGTLPAIWFPLNFPMSWVGWVYNYVFILGGCLVLFLFRFCSDIFQLHFWINFFFSNPISCHCPMFLNGDWHWCCHWSSGLLSVRAVGCGWCRWGDKTVFLVAILGICMGQ